MHNLKSLREKRNQLFAEGTKIFKNVDEEVRDLNEEEGKKLEELRSEIDSLDATIEKEKEFRSKGSLEETQNHEQETRNLAENNKEAEVRSMELFLRGHQDSQEFRDLQSGLTAGNDTEGAAGNGGITIPLSVFDQIIQKLEQQSPVFAMSMRYPSANGRLKIARETAASDDEGFIGEGVDAPELTAALKSITLDQKRVAAAFQLTNSLINDSATDVVAYATNRIARAIGRTISRNILIGKKGTETESFAPVVSDEDVKVTDVANSVTVDDLIGMYTDLHQGYQNGAAWVVAPSVFRQMAALKDGNGEYLIFRGTVDGNPDYTLFGSKVYEDDALESAPDGKKIVFGNFGIGYAVLLKKDMNLVHVTQDTKQALAGGHLVVIDAYLDGGVQNPDAFIIGKVASKG